METILCHVSQDNFIVIGCPSCEKISRVSVSKFKNKKHTFVARCNCDYRFQIQLNFRKYYRKSVHFSGEVVIQKPGKTDRRKIITVIDLSMTGLRFKMVDSADLKIGDVVRVKFDLIAKHPTTIDKYAIVRFVGAGEYGCEFKDLDLEEKELGFFLFAE